MSDDPPEKPLSTGEWVVTLLIFMIPVVNIVMHFVWAFGEGNIGRRNLCRAQLLLFAIMLGLALIVGVTLILFTGVLAGLTQHHHGRW